MYLWFCMTYENDFHVHDVSLPLLFVACIKSLNAALITHTREVKEPGKFREPRKIRKIQQRRRTQKIQGIQRTRKHPMEFAHS